MLHSLAAGHTVEAAGFILSGIKGIFYLIGGIIAAVLCAVIAKSKGYSGGLTVLFAILGFFFSIITLIVVLVLPRQRSA